ncbi:MAG: GNAT family N-acetyltransferase [Chloroflexi bacterium]|nr:GNAT family N-acetyltransferase [Chloroflexota bacterium]
MSDVQLTSLTEANLGKVQMFCGHSPTYRRGYDAKTEWMRDRMREGMRYTLLRVNGHNAGMNEYVPGEFAWRGVEAAGYLFIHCFWVIGQNRGHGYGRQLLEACLEDAKGTNGVAVVVSKAHWLPTPKLFLKNGFELADHAEPSFDLLVRRFNPNAPPPRFKRNVSKIPPGLTLYHSDQCPYTQNMPDSVTKVGEQLKVPVRIIRVDSAKAAQESPCLYGTLGYFFNGELLAYRPVGTEKLLELLKPKL